MHKKIVSLTAMVLMTGSLAFSQTPPILLVNTDFSSYDQWIAGTNQYNALGEWQGFVGTVPVDEPETWPYTHAERIAADGNGFVYSSWDDNESDKLENFLFQEHFAGPSTGTQPSIFQPGDELVFRGKASAVRVGTDTSDMEMTAYIKVLGFNDIGWDNQPREWTVTWDVPTGSPAEAQAFELRTVLPDAETVLPALQVVQIGFGIVGSYDASSQTMDGGTIYFEDIEAFVEGGTVTWAGYPVDELGWADTGTWLGFVNTAAGDYVWSASLNNWMYLPESSVSASGAWTYILGSGN